MKKIYILLCSMILFFSFLVSGCEFCWLNSCTNSVSGPDATATYGSKQLKIQLTAVAGDNK